jgi:hypothetical protein
MAKKKLTIKGITFPDFGDDDSKKNFRLVFYIGYTDKNGDETVEVISKPGERHWQWRNSKKDAFLKSKIVGDSVELDTIVLRNGDGEKIPASSNKIAEIDGDITDITVQFMDVHDKTLADILVKNVLPELLTVWKATGLNPIDLAPIPGGVKVLIKDKFNLEEMADNAAGFYAKKLKDKTLHSISQSYNGEKQIVLKEKDVEWGDDKETGTYAVKIGVA